MLLKRALEGEDLVVSSPSRLCGRLSAHAVVWGKRGSDKVLSHRQAVSTGPTGPAGGFGSGCRGFAWRWLCADADAMQHQHQTMLSLSIAYSPPQLVLSDQVALSQEPAVQQFSCDACRIRLPKHPPQSAVDKPPCANCSYDRNTASC